MRKLPPDVKRAHDLERYRKRYERNREAELARQAARRLELGTALERAIAEGPEAVAHLREQWRERNDRRSAKKRIQRGKPAAPYRAVKLIVTIAPRDVSASVRAEHPSLAVLIEKAGPATVRRLRRQEYARRDFAFWSAARESLPERPVAAEFEAWMIALSRGEHGGVSLKTSTLKNIYYSLMALYRSAHMLGLSSRNPMAEFPEPMVRDFPAAFSWRVITEAFPALIAATSDWRERAFFSVLRYTALRVSEVLGLRREHVLLLPGGRVELQIAEQRSRESPSAANPHGAPLKHVRQRRILPVLNPDLIDALVRARRETPSPVSTWDSKSDPTRKFQRTVMSPFLFPFSRHYVAEILYPRLHAVAPTLPHNVGFHAFRHAFSAEARLIARASVDEISQWLGHSSTDVTRVYLRTLLGEQPDLTDFAARAAAAQLQRPVAPANVTEIKRR